MSSPFIKSIRLKVSLLLMLQCGHQPAVVVWDASDGSCIAELKAHKYGISCVKFSPNGMFCLDAYLFAVHLKNARCSFRVTSCLSLTNFYHVNTFVSKCRVVDICVFFETCRKTSFICWISSWWANLSLWLQIWIFDIQSESCDSIFTSEWAAFCFRWEFLCHSRQQSIKTLEHGIFCKSSTVCWCRLRSSHTGW